MANPTKHTIRKVLIANRGEIATRIKRTVSRLGLECVLLVSSEESESSFARDFAERAVINTAHPKDVYLNIKQIIETAKNYGCDSIHPGYGFLSESAEFSRLVREAGLLFIGPLAESMEKLGSKTAARELAKKVKVPIVPGCQGDLGDGEIVEFASKQRFPLLIKAAAGGGGRGMRVVRSLSELKDQLSRARQEAYKFFGSDNVFIERYIENPRHVEVQIVGDCFGNVIHLGTRDCSTQRRHQKLIEEAPAPGLTSKVRRAIEDAAVKMAKAVKYSTVGTAEFLVEGDKFYFLEMNTRLQVEHPVTEMITGLDLIELQISTASGEKLNLKQNKIKFIGHALEFRINSEDFKAGFIPDVGIIEELILPEDSLNLRIDFGFKAGDKISPNFDSLIGKMIIHAEDRITAIKLAGRYLRKLRIEGVKTSLPFYRWFLIGSPFVNGPVSIKYVENTLTPELAISILTGDQIDSKHLAVGENYDTVRRYRVMSGSGTKEVEVLHRSDGFFEFRPLTLSGRYLPKRSWFVSNGLDYGLSLLTNTENS